MTEKQVDVGFMKLRRGRFSRCMWCMRASVKNPTLQGIMRDREGQTEDKVLVLGIRWDHMDIWVVREKGIKVI